MDNMSTMQNLILMIKMIMGSFGIKKRRIVINICDSKTMQWFDCVYDVIVEFLNSIEKMRCFSGGNACFI